MTVIGAYEAKTHLAALLDRVESGETITITRHGRAVAVLAPPPGAVDQTVDQVIGDLKRLRRGRSLGAGLTIRELIDAGRR